MHLYDYSRKVEQKQLREKRAFQQQQHIDSKSLYSISAIKYIHDKMHTRIIEPGKNGRKSKYTTYYKNEKKSVQVES